MQRRTRRGSLLARYSRWLFPLNVCAAVGLCLVAAFMLLQMRRDTEERALLTSRSLIEVLGRDIGRNVELYDATLRTIVDAMTQDRLWALRPAELQTMLFERSPAAYTLAQEIVIDAEGVPIVSARPLPDPNVNLAGRDYFVYFKAHNDYGLHISRPQTSRFYGRPVLVLSRRLFRPDGSFGGVVACSIPIDYFRKLFSAIGSDYAGDIALYGPDDTLVMSEPPQDNLLGRSVADRPGYDRLRAAAAGSFVGPAILGAGERRIVFGQIGDLPLRLSVEASPTTPAASWFGKAVIIACAVLGLSATTVLLTWRLGAELAQRQAAEKALEALNETLERLAVTDALTGLYNRRRFDEALTTHWERCAAGGAPWSLILIDADLFKLYNDTYGHPAGDEVLKGVGREIAAALEQQGDAGYRIGGEEFAILLPRSDAAQAARFAESLRRAIRKLAIPHAASPEGNVTVSCGVAEMSPARHQRPVDLFEAADRALYEAKKGGRNQVARERADAEVVLLRSA